METGLMKVMLPPRLQVMENPRLLCCKSLSY